MPTIHTALNMLKTEAEMPATAAPAIFSVLRLEKTAKSMLKAPNIKGVNMNMEVNKAKSPKINEQVTNLS